MSTRYSGDPTNITTPLIRTITAAASAAGLIRLTTSVAHDFADNDRVYVYGVAGTTEANGYWTITVTGSTTFTLNGSTFTNAYTSGGKALDLSLSPAIQFPSDGEDGTAESILAALESLCDRTQYLTLRAGFGVPDDGFDSLDASQIGGGDPIATTSVAFSAVNSVDFVTIPANTLKAGDWLDVTIQGTLALVTVATANITRQAGIVMSHKANGASVYTILSATQFYLTARTGTAVSVPFSTPFTMRGRVLITDPTTITHIALIGAVDNNDAAATSCHVRDIWQAYVTIVRGG